MNKHSALSTRGSLLERAAELYDFGSDLRPAPAAKPSPAAPEKPVVEAESLPGSSPAPKAKSPEPRPSTSPRPSMRPAGRVAGVPGEARIDRENLAEAGFILPDAPVSALAEEFRIVKRQLLSDGARDASVDSRRQTILICSAQPDEGKTFCAVNLALSLAGERDVDVLLVDGDFAKPEVLSILGIEGGAGFIDAISDPAIDPESLVIRTDVEGLSVLPAGRHANDAAELLSSERARQVLASLTEGNPRRLIIFDSPPALMASPASVLAGQVGQVVMVVRADRTTEADLTEALGLLSGCDNISLMLNGAGFAASSRRFGTYYGYGQ